MATTERERARANWTRLAGILRTPERAWTSEESGVVVAALARMGQLQGDTYRVWCWHFLLGADMDLVLAQLRITKTEFQGAVSRIESALSAPELTTMNEPILQFFAYEHLPEKLQAVSKPFGDLARQIVDTLPRNAERTVALRKLLEAKDAAVRALLFKD